MSFRKQLLIVGMVFCVTQVFAGNIEKGFDALKIFNYFEAKQQFESGLKKSPAPAHYGLAVIYGRKDNPFYNIDSAFRHVIEAEKLYGGQKDKVKQKLKVYQYDYPAIDSLRQTISTGFYALAQQQFNEFSFQTFVMTHPWAKEIPVATHLRDSLGYVNAKKGNTSKDYGFFLEKYPSSTYYDAALSDFYLKQYQEQTRSGEIDAFEHFLKAFPQNPYTGDAQDRMYDLFTKSNKLQTYYQFTQTYPTNRNYETAWKRVYQLYMYDYSEERYDQFLSDYPNYPFVEELKVDKQMALQNLVPFRQQNLFGWMNYNGEIIYPATYETLGFFKEGLSLASKNGKYGYIDKANKVIIPLMYDAGYDFEQGRAIVELKGKYGIIDRMGKLLFDVEFEDIGSFSDGLIYATKDSLYEYFDKYGVKRFEKQFTEAFAFSNGKALVEVDGKKALIDAYGEFIVQPNYEDLALFNEQLFIVEVDEYLGVIDAKGNFVLPAEYDYIGKPVNNRAILVKNDLFGYMDDSAKIVIPLVYEMYPNYMQNANFVGGLAKIKSKGKFGIIDAKGKIVIPATYANLGNVSTLMAFNKGKTWGFIDQKNKVLVPATFEYAESFQKGLAVAEFQTLQGLINSTGKWVAAPEHTGITLLENGFYKTNDGAKLGLLSPKGEKITQNIYQIIKIVDKELILLSSPGQVHYFHIPTMRMIQPIFEEEK